MRGLLSLSNKDIHDIISRQYDEQEIIEETDLQFKRELIHIFGYPKQIWLQTKYKEYCNPAIGTFNALNFINTKYQSNNITTSIPNIFSLPEFEEPFRRNMLMKYKKDVFHIITTNNGINRIYKEMLIAVVNNDAAELTKIYQKQQIISKRSNHNNNNNNNSDDCKFDVNLVVNHVTPLVIACRLSNMEIVKILVNDFKADVNVAATNCETPLLAAVTFSNNEEIIDCLIENKADINYNTSTSKAKISILTAAIRFANVALTKKLISNGVVLTDKVNVAFVTNNLQIFDIIYDKFPHIIESQKVRICSTAIQAGSIDIIKRMIQLNLCDFDILSTAYPCMFANYETLITLEKTSSFNKPFPIYREERIIHNLAAFNATNFQQYYKCSAKDIELLYINFEKILDHFYAKEDDLMNLKTYGYYSPLHYAAIICDERIIEQILAKSTVDVTDLLWDTTRRSFKQLSRSPIVISVCCGRLYLVKKYFNELEIMHVYDLLLLAFRTKHIVLFEQILAMAIDKFKLNGKAIYHLISNMFYGIERENTDNANDNTNNTTDCTFKLNSPVVANLITAKRFESIMILHNLVGIDIYAYDKNYNQLSILPSRITSQPIDVFIRKHTPSFAKWHITNYTEYTTQLKMELKLIMIIWYVTANKADNKQHQKIKHSKAINLLPIELISIIFDKLVVLEGFAIYCLMPTLNYESFSKYYCFFNR